MKIPSSNFRNLAATKITTAPAFYPRFPTLVYLHSLVIHQQHHITFYFETFLVNGNSR